MNRALHIPNQLCKTYHEIYWIGTFRSKELLLYQKIKVKNEVVDYNQPNHRLKWLNIIIGNLKNNISGIYHGIGKREMPLFLNEQEYQFNHRYTDKEMFNKIKEYL